LIGLELRHAPRALREMLLQLRMNLGRKVAFDEIREEADEISAAGLGAHSVSLCDLCAGEPAS